jgi:hypothetical protein
MNKNTFKSVLAVLAGFVAIVILSTLTDVVMEKSGIFSGFEVQNQEGMYIWWMLLIALIYRIVYSVAGCYLTARLAPDRPMRHAMILGIVGILVSTLGAIVMWDKSSHWYPLALILVVLPCAWIGGKLARNPRTPEIA